MDIIMLADTLKDEIVCSLKSENIFRLILFGSQAYGNPDEESDVDLLVILDQEGVSKSYRNILTNKRKISEKLLNIRKKIPVDLLVYTKKEWELIKSSKSFFTREIEKKGINLI